jgi:uncharacterized protein
MSITQEHQKSVEPSGLQARKRPLVWALQTARVGDNAQVLEVCNKLEGETVVKQLVHNNFHFLPNYVLGSSLLSITRESAGTLVPPWPDVVVAVGRRTVATARWIKEASGGKTKLMHLGRPRAPLDDFDLIVTTPQYGLPRARNVIEVMLPFALPKRAPDAEYDFWQEAWSTLPRPLVAVMVGGGKYPLRMGEDEHLQLAAGINALIRKTGGSAIVMMSPRSSSNAAALIGSALSVPHKIYPWGPGKPNPYQAALEIADRFVVTSDSASMISEALATGQPVSLFSLPKSLIRLSWSARSGFGAYLASNGVLQPPRNISKLAEILLKQGVVCQLGQEFEPVNPVRRTDEIAIRRMKTMMHQR